MADKKKVKGKESNGYVVLPIYEKDIENQADFGTFRITRTRNCIAYTNYVGYSVITKPYTTTPQGGVTELSLYSWLNYVLESKEHIDAHYNEKHPDLDMTNGEWLEQMKIITEANITKPCVAFTDMDYAIEEALKHIKWLDDKSKQLQEAMAKNPQDEDEKENEKAFGDAIASDSIIELSKEIGND